MAKILHGNFAAFVIDGLNQSNVYTVPYCTDMVLCAVARNVSIDLGTLGALAVGATTGVFTATGLGLDTSAGNLHLGRT